jgi:dUTPase
MIQENIGFQIALFSSKGILQYIDNLISSIFVNKFYNLLSLDKKLFLAKRTKQIIIILHEKAEWESTESLLETKRGSGGFGHTGKK